MEGVQEKGRKKRHKKEGRKKSSSQERPVAARQVPVRKRRSTSVFPEIDVPHIEEPLPVCTLCGRPIDAIAEAIAESKEGTFSHFDCVLQKIAKEEHLAPQQKVSYIGRGVFAIVQTDEKGQLVFVKRIAYENAETFQFMKQYVEGCKKRK